MRAVILDELYYKRKLRQICRSFLLQEKIVILLFHLLQSDLRLKNLTMLLKVYNLFLSQRMFQGHFLFLPETYDAALLQNLKDCF